MQLIIAFLILICTPNQNEFIIDFGSFAGKPGWEVVNDGVMGGLSQSKVITLSNSIQFSGEISLKNNGGFASLRGGRNYEDLSGYSSVIIKYRSTGQDFALRLLKNDVYYLPYFKHGFQTTDWEWKSLKIPLATFKEYVLSSETGNSITNQDLEKIKRIGIIVSNKEEGPFKIEIDFIKFN